SVPGRLRSELERPQRLRRPPAKRPDELAVVLVRDLPRAVVELELLQRGQRAVALLLELEAPALERVPCGRRLAQEGPRDEDDARDREHRADDERGGHAVERAGAPAVP